VSVNLSFGRYDGPGTTHVIFVFTFNELNVQSVPDILKILQNLFDSVLTDVTKGMQEEDLVQITLECHDLDFLIRLPTLHHVIFVLYLDDATFIFQEPLRVHVITSLSSSTLTKADVCYIQLYTMVQDELFVGL
jgi:hypothetical protein